MENLLHNKANISMSEDDAKLYGNIDGLSLQNLFYTRHKCFPGCILFEYDERVGDMYINTQAVIELLIKNYNEQYDLEIIPYITKKICETDTQQDDNYSINFIINGLNIYGRIERLATESYILFDNNHIKEAQELADSIKQLISDENAQTDTYWRLAMSSGSYYLTKGKIKCPENFDIDKIYNDDFKKEDEKIKNFIETKDANGLVILHGDKGTGKSTYIKHLIHVNPTKKFVYVPSNLVSSFSEPSFGSFLSSLNNHIIVVEDCENVIQDRRQNNSASSVSLLLNMTDGILSDDLGIKFICTFNDDIKNIDPALLRRGRLVSKYEFKNLCIEKTNKLLEELGYDKSNKPMSLSDIFYNDNDSYESIKKSII
jgi:hypothetical protein